MAGHSSQCDWNMDQYDHECNCGATRPRRRGCVESELSAAQERIAGDKALVAALQRELRSFKP